MALAGSLVAQGRWDWKWAGAIAVVASVLGDLAGYGLGRMLSQEVLEKRGYWIGYTSARHASFHKLFDRWGLLTVFITRTFVSYLSSIANLFAGAELLSSFQVPGSCGDRAAAMDCGLYGPWISCRRRPGSSCQLPDEYQPLVLDFGGLRRLRSALARSCARALRLA